MVAYYNEMNAPDGSVRPHYREYAKWLDETSPERLARKRAEADLAFHRVGITFAVNGEDSGKERLIPFDIVPRIIPAEEWSGMSAGLKQRVKALNAFLQDIYHDQEILAAGHIPREQVLNNKQFRPEMRGVDVPGNVYAHIAGVDIVRAGEGEFYVLEDNLRVPSGVSYMIEDRKMMMRLFPELFSRQKVAPVLHYPDLLLDSLRTAAPEGVEEPTVVVLTPGAFNSAYFEHTYLAQQMGVELVEGRDLFVRDETVWMQTTRGHDLPPGRRRLPRSARLPQGLHAWRTGTVVSVQGRTGHTRQCNRHRRGRRQVDLPLCAGDDPLLSGRGTDPQ